MADRVFVILAHFVPSYNRRLPPPPVSKNPENQNLKKMKKKKKTLEILSFLQMCTINENHMIYTS